MRDITYSLDEHWLPTDCFVRLTVNDRFMGTGWFRFGPDFAECETYTALDGRVTQRMETKGRLQAFQNHAIVCDAWHMQLFDRHKGPAESTTRCCVVADTRCDADVFRSASACSTWEKRHPCRLPFERSFSLRSSPGLRSPPGDYSWCGGRHYIFLKGGWRYMLTEYEWFDWNRRA